MRNALAYPKTHLVGTKRNEVRWADMLWLGSHKNNEDIPNQAHSGIFTLVKGTCPDWSTYTYSEWKLTEHTNTILNTVCVCDVCKISQFWESNWDSIKLRQHDYFLSPFTLACGNYPFLFRSLFGWFWFVLWAKVWDEQAMVCYPSVRSSWLVMGKSFFLQ